MDTRTATTVEELIAAFEGKPSAVARALGTTPQAIVNCRKRGHLPARQFLIQRDILKSHGIEAPASLWGLAEPQDGAVA